MWKLTLWYAVSIGGGMFAINPGPETNLTFATVKECEAYMPKHWQDFGAPPAGGMGSYNSHCVYVGDKK